jgi:hypothetical protein
MVLLVQGVNKVLEAYVAKKVLQVKEDRKV